MKLSQFIELIKEIAVKYPEIRYVEPTMHIHIKKITGFKFYISERSFNIKLTEESNNETIIEIIRYIAGDYMGKGGN